MCVILLIDFALILTVQGSAIIIKYYYYLLSCVVYLYLLYCCQFLQLYCMPIYCIVCHRVMSIILESSDCFKGFLQVCVTLLI